jgi:ribosomal protein S27E
MKPETVLTNPHSHVSATRYLTVKCAWCGQRRVAITDRNSAPLRVSICRECANKLLDSRNLYHA